MASINDVIKGAIGIALVLIIVAAVVPTAMTDFLAINTTAWGATFAAIWDLIPLFGLLAIAILVIMIAIKALSD